MRGGRRPAALHAGRSGPRDRLRRPSRRRKLSERPASEAQPARPSAVLAPSRVQRRGVEARRAARALRGRRSRNGGRAGGTSRAARQRREVSRDLDTDGLSLVILSCGVQEGRPFSCLLTVWWAGMKCFRASGWTCNSCWRHKREMAGKCRPSYRQIRYFRLHVSRELVEGRRVELPTS